MKQNIRRLIALMTCLLSVGALGSRGAAMIDPYSDDDENRGRPFWTQEQLTGFVRKANDVRFQVGIHAIGDLGIQAEEGVRTFDREVGTAGDDGAEALHSFTLAAAFAAHQEDRLGRLEPGKWADFIVIDRDYFTVPAAEIEDIIVLRTRVGGDLVYDRNAGD